jgi:hypothetical protein
MVESLDRLERWSGGFPGGHEYSTLEGLEPNDDLQLVLDATAKLVNRWRGNQFVGLYIYGTPGNGKTHAAIGASRRLHDEIEADVFYRFMSAIEGDTRKQVASWTGARTAPIKKVTHNEFGSNLDARSPKTVLVLDEYTPDKQPYAIAAIEAAAQFGGCVIMTSNYPDPFQLVEGVRPTPTRDKMIDLALSRELDPDAYEAEELARLKREEHISASLRSRINSGFKFIQFNGPDRRENFFDS